MALQFEFFTWVVSLLYMFHHICIIQTPDLLVISQQKLTFVQFYWVFVNIIYFRFWLFVLASGLFGVSYHQREYPFYVAFIPRLLEIYVYYLLGHGRWLIVLKCTLCLKKPLNLNRLNEDCKEKNAEAGSRGYATVESAIQHTAIYAGQELWHFIYSLMDL